MLDVVEQQLGRMPQLFAVGRLRGRHQRAKLLQHVVGRFHQFRAVAQQATTAAQTPMRDPPRPGQLADGPRAHMESRCDLFDGQVRGNVDLHSGC